MAFYEVFYRLDGAVIVEASSKEEAINKVKGDARGDIEIMGDKDLIAGIDGYHESGIFETTIDGDAITVIDVLERKEF